MTRINREVGGHCTGFVVDEHTVATAAHCLWLARPRSWIRPSSLHVLTGYDRGRYTQHLRVTRYRIAPGFDPDGPAGGGQDWALLKLHAPFRGAPLPLAAELPPKGASLALAGYAQTRAHRLTRRVNCIVRGATAARFLHTCSTTGGHSGAPLIGWLGGRRTAFGIHSASARGLGLAVSAASVAWGRGRAPY